VLISAIRGLYFCILFRVISCDFVATPLAAGNIRPSGRKSVPLRLTTVVKQQTTHHEATRK
jgi:hypothetical protein